jgi:hypothetical protein
MFRAGVWVGICCGAVFAVAVVGLFGVGVVFVCILCVYCCSIDYYI